MKHRNTSDLLVGVTIGLMLANIIYLGMWILR